MRLDDKTALITGGASGFGAGMARTFVKEGAKVLLMDLNGQGAEALASELGDAARACQGDVTSATDTEAAVKAAIDLGQGRLDIVVNNAGWTFRNKPILDVTEAEFDRVYGVNVKSIFHMTRAIVPHMREAGGGSILNIGSTAGIRPRPGLTWYNSTKGAVNTLSRSMAVELAPDRIRVNCIAPVMGATALLEDFMGLPDTPENRAKFVATIPWGRMSEASDVANAALFLCEDTSEFITGVVLEVDGARTV